MALDFGALDEALRMAELLRPSGVRFKIGLELFCRHGPDGVARMQERTGPVLLDLKLHDIPHTVGQAVRSLAPLGVWGLTLHAGGGPVMLRAAVDAAAQAPAPVRCLAVTVLTSLDEQVLHVLGVRTPLAQQVAALATLARAAGCAGVVASPQEVRTVRGAAGPDCLVVTPGVRPRGAAAADQARVATPAEALGAGADHLVVGRPITGARDPRAALEAILEELAAGARGREGALGPEA